MFYEFPVSAEENAKYLYTMFASSDKNGAISINTVYSAGINGNIATKRPKSWYNGFYCLGGFERTWRFILCYK